VFGCFPRLLTEKITPDAQKIVTMARGETVAMGSTRLWRVQFGVPPNCDSTQLVGVDHTGNRGLHPQAVLGATPETTRGTRVLHDNSSVALAENTILN